MGATGDKILWLLGGIGDKLARLNTNAAVHYCTVITHCIIVVLAILHSTDFTLKHSRIECTIVGLISNFATALVPLSSFVL